MKKIIVLLSLIFICPYAFAGQYSTTLDKIENSLLVLHILMKLKIHESTELKIRFMVKLQPLKHQLELRN